LSLFLARVDDSRSNYWKRIDATGVLYIPKNQAVTSKKPGGIKTTSNQQMINQQ
ncbi:hypothetical protein FRB91_008798, partial [Serendipita sp. 411]